MRCSPHLVDVYIVDTWVVGRLQLDVVGYKELICCSAR